MWQVYGPLRQRTAWWSVEAAPTRLQRLHHALTGVSIQAVPQRAELRKLAVLISTPGSSALHMPWHGVRSCRWELQFHAAGLPRFAKPNPPHPLLVLVLAVCFCSPHSHQRPACQASVLLLLGLQLPLRSV